MREILLLLVVAVVAAGIVFGVAVLLTGADRGMAPAEPDDRMRRLPGDRPLTERDLAEVRFDTAARGYRMRQVDGALSRVAYDLGYKQELIAALEAEVDALRSGRTEEADLLRERRMAAREPARPPAYAGPVAVDAGPADADRPAPRDAETEADAEPEADGAGEPAPRAADGAEPAPDGTTGHRDEEPADGEPSPGAAAGPSDEPVADDAADAAGEAGPGGNGRAAGDASGTGGARSAAVARPR